MSFNDTTYCNNPNCDGSCGREWTPQLKREAERWWGGPGAPVAFADFHTTTHAIPQRQQEAVAKIERMYG